jgi:hypothetical protein
MVEMKSMYANWQCSRFERPVCGSSNLPMDIKRTEVIWLSFNQGFGTPYPKSLPSDDHLSVAAAFV